LLTSLGCASLRATLRVACWPHARAASRAAVAATLSPLARRCLGACVSGPAVEVDDRGGGRSVGRFEGHAFGVGDGGEGDVGELGGGVAEGGGGWLLGV